MRSLGFLLKSRNFSSTKLAADEGEARGVKISSLSKPCRARRSAAYCPNLIGRVSSGCSDSENSPNRSRMAFQKSWRRTHARSRSRGESPGGLSIPGARGTVLEARASYGSRCSAVSLEESSVGQQAWLSSHNAIEPVLCSPPMAPQGLTFPMCPSCRNEVDVPDDRVESRLNSPSLWWTPLIRS